MALGAFARVWLERLPLAGDPPAGGHLQLRSLAGVVDDEPARTALAQVTRLEALLLALALESRGPRRTGPARRVRLAELVLTLLHGSGHLAELAPGFGDPFDVALACQQLARIDLSDTWDPPHLPFVAPARPCQDTWAPPAELTDQLTGRRVGLDEDGVLAFLGTSRLEAAEEAVRAAHPGDRVTVIVQTSDPAEIGRLVRVRVSDLTGCLRRVFAPGQWPRLRLVSTTAPCPSAGGCRTPPTPPRRRFPYRPAGSSPRHGRGAANPRRPLAPRHHAPDGTEHYRPGPPTRPAPTCWCSTPPCTVRGPRPVPRSGLPETEVESELIDLAVAGLVTSAGASAGGAPEAGKAVDAERRRRAGDGRTRAAVAERTRFRGQPGVLDLCRVADAIRRRCRTLTTTATLARRSGLDRLRHSTPCRGRMRRPVGGVAPVPAISRPAQRRAGRAKGGALEYVTDSTASYHAMWFQLHEDLLVTLGIPRW